MPQIGESRSLTLPRTHSFMDHPAHDQKIVGLYDPEVPAAHAFPMLSSINPCRRGDDDMRHAFMTSKLLASTAQTEPNRKGAMPLKEGFGGENFCSPVTALFRSVVSDYSLIPALVLQETKAHTRHAQQQGHGSQSTDCWRAWLHLKMNPKKESPRTSPFSDCVRHRKVL